MNLKFNEIDLSITESVDLNIDGKRKDLNKGKNCYGMLQTFIVCVHFPRSQYL